MTSRFSAAASWLGSAFKFLLARPLSFFALPPFGAMIDAMSDDLDQREIWQKGSRYQPKRSVLLVIRSRYLSSYQCLPIAEIGHGTQSFVVVCTSIMWISNSEYKPKPAGFKYLNPRTVGHDPSLRTWTIIDWNTKGAFRENTAFTWSWLFRTWITLSNRYGLSWQWRTTHARAHCYLSFLCLVQNLDKRKSFKLMASSMTFRC